MIKVIYGNKGMGKSRRLCSEANERFDSASGTVIFIDKDNDHMYDLNRNIRFINAAEYGVTSKQMFMGFIAGIAAGDFDLQALFINGFVKLVHEPAAALEDMFEYLDGFCAAHNVDITISITADNAPCPEFMQKYCS